MTDKIEVDNSRVRELTKTLLFSSREEDEVVSEALVQIYSGMIALAICGFVGESLDGLLSIAHENVKPTYEAIRDQLTEGTYDA